MVERCPNYGTNMLFKVVSSIENDSKVLDHESKCEYTISLCLSGPKVLLLSLVDEYNLLTCLCHQNVNVIPNDSAKQNNV